MALACALASCADPPRAHVHLEVVPGAPELAEYLDGASAWIDLDFVPSFSREPKNECLNVRDRDCEITIGIAREVNLHARYGADGLADRATRTIIIDARWSGWALRALAAHEIGHVLLDTDRHLAPGVPGVMAVVNPDSTPSSADFQLACDALAICVQGAH